MTKTITVTDKKNIKKTHVDSYKDEIMIAKKWFNNEMELLVNRFLEKFPEYFAEYERQDLDVILYQYDDYIEENVTYHQFIMDAFFEGKISINTRNKKQVESFDDD